MLNPEALSLGVLMHEFVHYLLWVKEQNFGYHNKRFKQVLTQTWVESEDLIYSICRPINW